MRLPWGTRLYNTIYDLEPSTEYRWAVRAENSDGPSDWVFAEENFTTWADHSFNIELIFLDSFDPDKEEWIREIVSQWEHFFGGMDDYVFDVTTTVQIHQGRRIRFQEGRRIDDFLLYVDKLTEETGNYKDAVWDVSPWGLGGASLFRPGGDIPLIGTIRINGEDIESSIIENWDSEWIDIKIEDTWRKVFHHELGHVFGIGVSPVWNRHIEWDDNFTVWYTGPNGVRQYHLMAPDHTEIHKGIPLEPQSLVKPRAAYHWLLFSPMKWGFFTTYWLHDNGLPNISRTTLGVFEDIGWNVKYESGLERLPTYNPEKGLPSCWIRERTNNFHLCPFPGETEQDLEAYMYDDYIYIPSEESAGKSTVDHPEWCGVGLAGP